VNGPLRRAVEFLTRPDVPKIPIPLDHVPCDNLRASGSDWQLSENDRDLPSLAEFIPDPGDQQGSDTVGIGDRAAWNVADTSVDDGDHGAADDEAWDSEPRLRTPVVLGGSSQLALAPSGEVSIDDFWRDSAVRSQAGISGGWTYSHHLAPSRILPSVCSRVRPDRMASSSSRAEQAREQPLRREGHTLRSVVREVDQEQVSDRFHPAV
jgi:hypothetical protein